MDNKVLLVLGIIIFIIICVIVKKIKDTRETKHLNKIPLNDPRDKNVALSSDAKSTISRTKVATSNVQCISAARLNITTNYLDNVLRLVSEANTIIYNSQHPSLLPKASTLDYHKNLYYRMVKAAKLLESCENQIGSEVMKLHRIKFNNSISRDDRRKIIELQAQLPKLQSLICRFKKESWNAIHNQKINISKCGNSGRHWYNRNLRNKQIKYGK